MSREVDELQKIIDTHKNIVFFGGAGVSTESGIPDFRSQDGLYNLQYKYPPEQIISHSFFVRDPKEFYRFYKDKMLILDVEPNAAHKKLAELEAAGKLLAVVGTTVCGAESFTVRNSLKRVSECRRAMTAAEPSSRMSSSMKKALTTT